MKWKAIIVFAVPDPDLEIRCVCVGGGGGEGLQKTFFQPFGPHCGLKIRGGRAPWAPPRDRPLLCIILVPKLWSVVWSSSRLQKKGYSKSNRAITNGYRYSRKPGNIRSSFWEPPNCLYQGFRKSVTVMAIDCGNILPLEMFLLLVHEHLFTI